MSRFGPVNSDPEVRGGEARFVGTRAAEVARVDVIATADRSMRYRQNLWGRRIALVILPTNHLHRLRILAPRIVEAIRDARPGDKALVPPGPSPFP